MDWFRNCTLAFIVIAAGTAQTNAQTVPPLLANFPVTQEAELQQAYADRIRASFPRDIKTSTLTALLEMDGFDVTGGDGGYTASFLKTDFPCITDYNLSWQESDVGRVEDLTIAVKQKCV